MATGRAARGHERFRAMLFGATTAIAAARVLAYHFFARSKALLLMNGIFFSIIFGIM
jgi:hypothetical protein